MHLQVSSFVKVLSSMHSKVQRRAQQVQGPLAIAGVLTRKKVMGKRDAVTRKMRKAATVFHSDTASIRHGAFNLRTVRGSHAHGRTHTDHFVYVPFQGSRGKHNPCVMKVEQIVLVKQKKMGWPQDEARLVVGTIYDHLTVREGMGMEKDYHDDPKTGACCVPRFLYAAQSKLASGYPWAVHLHQVNCPVAYLPGSKGDHFVTISKMGFHSRTDLERWTRDL